MADATKDPAAGATRDMTIDEAPPLHRPGLTPPALPPAALPRHVAVVMDGNGRWANARGLPRTEGHRVGEANLLDVVAGAVEIGVSELSAYAFSTENWRRSPGEVRFIMGFARKVLRAQRDILHSWNVKVRWVGRAPRLWKSVLRELREAERLTAHNTGLVLNLCINYGGRAEIADATRAIAEDVAAGRLKASSINEKTIQRYLYSPTMRDVDLFIRTGDEQRTSNFLMWSSSYAELYFSPLAWPDFNRTELWKACEVYAGRERRYGGAVDKVLQEPGEAGEPQDDEDTEDTEDPDDGEQ
ncbi:polyprenyl diphosphate synthase [Actinomyces sp. ZJ308]|uniref:polyprenyl diphosphate synthase n=1 Tax=Actinomyces sp. ZJ308 TaxID=2708342 RepID=UPI001AB06204|nr:polyprenyl diphosphate synthase [Actinomyces sp. ZJ308]